MLVLIKNEVVDVEVEVELGDVWPTEQTLCTHWFVTVEEEMWIEEKVLQVASLKHKPERLGKVGHFDEVQILGKELVSHILLDLMHDICSIGIDLFDAALDEFVALKDIVQTVREDSLALSIWAVTLTITNLDRLW